jgi:hypothetical protein
MLHVRTTLLRPRRLLGYLVALCTLSACAGVNYRAIPVKAARVDASPEQLARVYRRNLKADLRAMSGLRYYDTSTYLLIYPDGVSKVHWQLMQLPDQTKLRVVKPYNFLSSLQAKLYFQNGVLVRAGETGDSTRVPQAVIQAIGQIAPLLLAAADGSKDADVNHVPAPALYKLVLHDGTYVLMGKDVGFKINVSRVRKAVQ